MFITAFKSSGYIHVHCPVLSLGHFHHTVLVLLLVYSLQELSTKVNKYQCYFVISQ
jgi:hypothetical protein